MEVLHILNMNCTCLKNNANLVFEINVLNFWTTLLKLSYQLDICFWNDFFLMLQAKNKVPTKKSSYTGIFYLTVKVHITFVQNTIYK